MKKKEGYQIIRRLILHIYGMIIPAKKQKNPYLEVIKTERYKKG